MKKLSTQLTLSILAVVLITMTLISLSSNFILKGQFEKYISAQHQKNISEITKSLSLYYSPLTRTWDLGSVHALGMYSLNEGYILKLFDNSGTDIWNAENHNIVLCSKVMSEISMRMAQYGQEGGFSEHVYVVENNGQNIGTLKVSYFGPIFMNENEFSFIKSLNMILIIAGLFAVVFSILIGGILARRIARPITKISVIAKEIANGNYAMHFEGETKIIELKSLMSVINYLSSMLSKQEKFRKQLSADVAHELRTPLTTLSSHLEAMTLHIWEPTPDRLKNCHEEILRLNTLVADLEHLERAEGENLTLSKTPTDLRELLSSVCGSFERELLKKDLTFTLEGDSTIVNVDKDKIRQVACNLMSNAVKYTPEHGEIRVQIQDSEKNGIFIIEDTGIGIPSDELPHIFERFYRADKSRNRGTGGTGLGLAIANAIVNAHEGSIEVQSELNHGSRFMVTIPK